MTEQPVFALPQPISAGDLREGDRLRYLGALRTVRVVERSLGSGWHVTFSDGPSATFVGAVYVLR
jgi:hypothetical protein